MNTQIATESLARERRSARALVVSALGPAAIAAGVLWALVQPWRITLLHPHGQGFWWLVVEPPILVALVGVLFSWKVAPELLEDLEQAEEG